MINIWPEKKLNSAVIDNENAYIQIYRSYYEGDKYSWGRWRAADISNKLL